MEAAFAFAAHSATRGHLTRKYMYDTVSYTYGVS
jgi:hypothetical protein